MASKATASNSDSFDIQPICVQMSNDLQKIKDHNNGCFKWLFYLPQSINILNHLWCNKNQEPRPAPYDCYEYFIANIIDSYQTILMVFQSLNDVEILKNEMCPIVKELRLFFHHFYQCHVELARFMDDVCIIFHWIH